METQAMQIHYRCAWRSPLATPSIEPGTPYVLRQWDSLSKKTHAASVYRFLDICRGKIFQQLYKRTRFEGQKGYTAIKKELPGKSAPSGRPRTSCCSHHTRNCELTRCRSSMTS